MLRLDEDFINPGTCRVMYNTVVQMDGAQCSPPECWSEEVRSG